MRRWLKILAFGAVAGAGCVAAANAYVILSTRGEATDDVGSLHHAQAAIVLGAGVMPDGRMSGMLADRVAQAAALWHAGKVDRVLVSGDHRTWAYNEPGTMRNALIRDGVPAADIFTDHAGLDTWSTMVRARRVFRVQSAIVVTQRFHIARALYLAREAGLDAEGLTSDLHGYGMQGRIAGAREVAGRAKAVVEVALGRQVTLGPQVPITGDGRTSWGPAPPPGTPPAGAPGAR